MQPPAPRRALQPGAVAELDGGPIEYAWTDGYDDRAPVVLLHEGLGCVALWRDFPFLVAAGTGRRVLAYSRYGYGGSGPAALPRPAHFMHAEALDVLPALARHLDLPPAILVGHSDGASIALIAAAAHAVDLVAIGVLAPHVFVEDRSLDAIAAIRGDYLGDDGLRRRLGRYHRDPDMAFWGWNDVWLADAFRSWDITAMLGSIDVPVVAVQGLEDPYGSTAHVEAIESRVQGRYRGVVLASTGHAPHVEDPVATVEALRAAMADLP
ncbi:MAG: alpha/beta fold hydrolase [Acidimicrobiales bacterium]